MKISNTLVTLGLVTLGSVQALAGIPMTQPTTRSSAIQSIIVNPHGDADGVVLADGSVVRFPPHAVLAAAKLKVGATVRATGTLVGTTLFDGSLAIGSDTIVDAAAGPGGPGAGPSLTVSGTVARLLVNRENQPDGLMFADGTVVRTEPDGMTGITVGAKLTVTGHGGKFALGTSVDADTIAIGSGKATAITRPAPPAPPPAPPAAKP